MDSLVYFAFWAGLIFLMMRLGCGAHIMGHGHGKRGAPATDKPAGEQSVTPRWIPPEIDSDPVCSRTVQTATAKSAVHDGWIYYFCSSECRERFEANPETYLRKGEPQPPTQLEHSHA